MIWLISIGSWFKSASGCWLVESSRPYTNRIWYMEKGTSSQLKIGEGDVLGAVASLPASNLEISPCLS